MVWGTEVTAGNCSNAGQSRGIGL